jgi:hypothetical protein
MGFHRNHLAGHQCPIIHQLNPETRVDVKNDQLQAIKARVEIISTSYTRYDVQSWFRFSITYNHKTNH